MQPTAEKNSALNTGFRTVIAYGFLILALCLMIADFCRLARAPDATPFAASAHSNRANRF